MMHFTIAEEGDWYTKAQSMLLMMDKNGSVKDEFHVPKHFMYRCRYFRYINSRNIPLSVCQLILDMLNAEDFNCVVVNNIIQRSTVPAYFTCGECPDLTIRSNSASLK
jgi:hypothetical protein